MKLFNLQKEQKELLSHYYKFIDKRTVSLKLSFDNFSDLIDNDFGDDSVEKLNSLFFEALNTAFDELPIKYHLQVEIHIDNFGEYTKDEARNIIMDNIALKINSQRQLCLRKNIVAAILLSCGASFLVLSYFLNRINVKQLFIDIINISGTLLVWEAGSKYFLEKNQERSLSRRYAYKLKKITID